MLSDWERRSLASIEDALQRDRRLAAVLEKGGEPGGLRAALDRFFYPLGYLACALVFMIGSVGVGEDIVIASILGGLGLWGYIEWRARPRS